MLLTIFTKLVSSARILPKSSNCTFLWQTQHYSVSAIMNNPTGNVNKGILKPTNPFLLFTDIPTFKRE